MILIFKIAIAQIANLEIFLRLLLPRLLKQIFFKIAIARAISSNIAQIARFLSDKFLVFLATILGV